MIVNWKKDWRIIVAVTLLFSVLHILYGCGNQRKANCIAECEEQRIWPDCPARCEEAERLRE